MQITEIAVARTAWIANLAAVNYEGIALGPLHRALLERYRFLNPPSPGPEMLGGTAGLIYKAGEFFHSGKIYSIDLSVFQDGLVADCRTSTKICDAFLEDLSTWAATTFGFRDVKLARTRV